MGSSLQGIVSRAAGIAAEGSLGALAVLIYPGTQQNILVTLVLLGIVGGFGAIISLAAKGFNYFLIEILLFDLLNFFNVANSS